MQQCGSTSGSFSVAVPSSVKKIAECERDVARTLVAGGIAVLTPTLFEEVCRRPERQSSHTGEVTDAGAGDVSNTSVRDAIADFREQLLEAIEDTVSEAALRQQLQEMAQACLLLTNLTIGPALDFTIAAGFPPRILHQRFVIVVAERSIRVATLGFVGDPVLGKTPAEQRTPFVARLLTENLLGWKETGVDRGISVHYRVREVAATESTIASCISTEVPMLQDHGENPPFAGAAHPDASSPRTLSLAGVEIPSQSMVEMDEATFFGVRVTPADGSDSWMIKRRYQDFRSLYSCIEPETGHLVAVSFPRKHLRAVLGQRLEARRRGLESWLGEVVREAQLRRPAWLGPVVDFLDVRSHQGVEMTSDSGNRGIDEQKWHGISEELEEFLVDGQPDASLDGTDAVIGGTLSDFLDISVQPDTSPSDPSAEPVPDTTAVGEGQIEDGYVIAEQLSSFLDGPPGPVAPESDNLISSGDVNDDGNAESEGQVPDASDEGTRDNASLS